MKKANWNEVFNDNKLITITFDESSFPDIRKMLGFKNLECSYCGKRLSKLNIGGIMRNRKTICRNAVCMIHAIDEGAL